MRKEILIHSISFIAFFALITILHKSFTPVFIMFWIGGVVGTLLPDIDHLIYVYFLKPHELTSQRTSHLINQGALEQGVNLLVATSSERTNMIFHSLWFQIVFLALTFWVVSSTGSLFGHGLVLAFSLHILTDQLKDFLQNQNLNSWFVNSPIKLPREQQLFYLLGVGAILLFLGFL